MKKSYDKSIKKQVLKYLEELENQYQIEEKSDKIFEVCVNNLIKPFLEYVIENVDLENQSQIQKKIINILEQLESIILKNEKEWKTIKKEIKKHLDYFKDENGNFNLKKNIQSIELLGEEIDIIEQLITRLEQDIMSLAKSPNNHTIEEVNKFVNSIIEKFHEIILETESVESDFSKSS